MLRPSFDFFSLAAIELLNWELCCVVGEEASEFEIVLGVQVRLDGYAVVQQLQELLLEGVDFFSREKWVDVSEIGVAEVTIIPHLLGNKQRAEHDWSPVGGVQWEACESNEAVDIDEADDAALGAKLGAVVECFDELVDVVNCRSFAKECQSSCIVSPWIFSDVLLLAEEEQVALTVNLPSEAHVFDHLRVYNGRDSLHHGPDVWGRDCGCSVYAGSGAGAAIDVVGNCPRVFGSRVHFYWPDLSLLSIRLNQ